MNTKPQLTRALMTMAGLALAVAANAATPTRHYAPPPDSYLRYSVYSVNQLVQEVEANPAVRARYARQFQIPESQVGSYMRRNLVESYVPQSGTYSVYCVNRAGKVYTIRQKFRKGTKVFALRNGEPVMKWICGNPLMRYHAELAMAPIVSQKVSPSIQALTPTDVSPSVEAVVPSETGAGLPTLVSVPLTVGSSSVFPSAARALFALPLLGFLSQNGGGGGGTPPPPTPHTAPAVPEPSAPLLLLAALPLAALAVVKRRAGTTRP